MALVDEDRTGVVRVEGAFDGLADLLLAAMGGGAGLEEAKAIARHEGHSEAAVQGALDGSTTAARLARLAQDVFGTTVPVEVLGIGWLTPDDIAAAHGRGQRWRLVARATPWCARVEPVPLAHDHPLRTAAAGTVLVVRGEEGEAVALTASVGTP
jgi:homoserine dehydrogenase